MLIKNEEEGFEENYPKLGGEMRGSQPQGGYIINIYTHYPNVNLYLLKNNYL